MFVGHLPAGYILTKKLQKSFNYSKYLWIGLLGGIFPDLDIIYFYLIDHRQTLHHLYWIHIPFYWNLISMIFFIVVYLTKNKNLKWVGVVFFSGIFLHLLLDTIVGGISWLYPLSNKSFFIFDVPAVYDWWVYNFVFHWTFLFEVTAIILAVFLLIKSRQKQQIAPSYPANQLIIANRSGLKAILVN